MKFKAIAMGLGGLALATSCTNDVIEEVNHGPEISFTSRMTRSNVINSVADLKSFKVFAKSGGFTGNMFIDGETATKQQGSTIFTMSKTYHWPQGVNSIEFWAYAPTSTSATINTEGALIKDVKPTSYKADEQFHNSGATHEDLIVAYEEAQRSAGTSVALNFNHALSQIEIKAINGGASSTTTTNKNEYRVKIKGTWVVNALESGNLTFSKKEELKDVHYMSWAPGGNRVVYGREFQEFAELSHEPIELLGHDNAFSSELMLIPQTLNYWDLDGNDKETNSAKGAYIILLCRVEEVHEGAQHTGGGDYTTTEGDKHVHQMFPIKDVDKTFNENLYGYVCVPISDKDADDKKMKWVPGKKYSYTLEFCGATSGAGIYPPKDDVTNFNLPTGNGNYIYAIPTHEDPDKQKKPGDAVLDNPIQFSVTVSPWDPQWKPGDTGGDYDMK